MVFGMAGDDPAFANQNGRASLKSGKAVETKSHGYEAA